ncbi:MAG: MFS transporter, partial [Alicyclobacillus sp.]|nr:MFS transporter [Alicyclobacillus sp.]
MTNASAWRTISVLSLVPLLMVLGNSVLIPALPQMAAHMHVSRLQISLLITLFSVPAGVVIPLAGYLSDRWGRKRVVIPALWLFGFGGLLAGCAAWWLHRPYPWVLTGRVLQGIGAAGTAPIAMAWLSDLFRGAWRSKALGVNEAGNATGKVVSPIIGAGVSLLAWYAVFFVFPVLCLPLTLFLWKWIPDSQPYRVDSSSDREPTPPFIRILQREARWLSVAYLCGATALFTLFGTLFYLSDWLEEQLGIGGLGKGGLLAFPLFVLVVTAVTVGVVIRKQTARMKWCLVLGQLLMAVSFAAGVWLGQRAWTLMVCTSVAALGTGIVLPSLNMLITSSVGAAQRGRVTSFYGSVRF